MPHTHSKKKEVELDLSSYATKSDLENATCVDISEFVKKMIYLGVDKLDIDKLKNAPSGLRNLKSKLNKSDVHMLVSVSVDLSKLNDVVKNDAGKKTEHDELVKKVNAIDTSGFVKKNLIMVLRSMRLKVKCLV